MRVRFASSLRDCEAPLADGTFTDKKYSVSSMHSGIFFVYFNSGEGVGLSLKHANITLVSVSGCTFPTRVMPTRSTTPLSFSSPKSPLPPKGLFFYIFAPACLTDLPWEVDCMLDYVRSRLMLRESIR